LRVGRVIVLRWPVRLAGWLLGAVPAVLLAGWPWLAVGPAAFEVLLLAVTLRASRRTSQGGGGGTEGPRGAADREPRRPLPVAGAGAAAMPVPTEKWTARLA
jgi:hypothetical protein